LLSLFKKISHLLLSQPYSILFKFDFDLRLFIFCLKNLYLVPI